MSEGDRVLVVACHPRPDSFGARLVAEFANGVTESGRIADVVDLYDETFPPVFTAEDYAQFEGGTLEPRLLAEQARIDRADEIVIISPLWWLSFPAMLKGWFDRVWSNGWAYEFANDPEGSLLRPRPFTVVLTTGGSARTFGRRGYAAALDCLIRDGILGWCGVSDSRLILLHDTGFDEKSTHGHLRFAHALAATGWPVLDDVDPSRITVLADPVGAIQEASHP
jgi:NAD(P)H dehydrogenase (quinone)